MYSFMSSTNRCKEKEVKQWTERVEKKFSKMSATGGQDEFWMPAIPVNTQSHCWVCVCVCVWEGQRKWEGYRWKAPGSCFARHVCSRQKHKGEFNTPFRWIVYQSSWCIQTIKNNGQWDYLSAIDNHKTSLRIISFADAYKCFADKEVKWVRNSAES